MNLTEERRKKIAGWAAAAALIAGQCPAASAAGKQTCSYVTERNEVVQTSSPEGVPAKYKGKMRCMSALPDGYMASPDDVTLKGAVREENMVTAVGPVKLRWPRKVELLFGRTPQRGMADAAQTVSRALKQGGFSPAVQSLNLNWNVVFMDAEVPTAQIPSYLISSCHPGWMTPPADIYIVAQRVAGGCGGGKAGPQAVADAQLAAVLIHEMGHAVEFHLLNGAGGFDRMRAEGFASWFEQYASNFSSVIPHGQLRRAHAQAAREAIRRGPLEFEFRGTAEDYSRASMYFTAVVDRRGIIGLMDVYRTIAQENLTLIQAIRRRLGWSEKQLAKEVEKAAG